MKPKGPTAHKLLKAGSTPHRWLMFGLVESRWGGKPNTYLWYEICRRSVACLICGSIKHGMMSEQKWAWVLEHEELHLSRLDQSKCASAEMLICLRLGEHPYWAAGRWRIDVREVIAEVFGEVPKPQRELFTTGGPPPCETQPERF